MSEDNEWEGLEHFVEGAQAHTGAVVIMAGSDSDQPHIDKLVGELDKWGLPYDVRIASAHKQPEELMAAIDEYNDLDGTIAYIAVAGGTDALSGTLSFHAEGPVITCPPDTRYSNPERTNELNMSCLTNPPGSSNAYVGRPGNAVRFVAQIFAGNNPAIRTRLQETTKEKIGKLDRKGDELRAGYVERQIGR